LGCSDSQLAFSAIDLPMKAYYVLIRVVMAVRSGSEASSH